MKVKALKHLLLPLGIVERNRRRIVKGQVLEAEKLGIPWVKDKIKEGFFEEVKKVEEKIIETEVIQEEVKPKRKYNRKK